MKKLKKAKRLSNKLTNEQIDDLKRELFYIDPDLQVETLSMLDLMQFFCHLTHLETLHEKHNKYIEQRRFSDAFLLVAEIEREIAAFNDFTESRL
jgi:hypothetical protein